ncbi:MAG: alkaline phosphatase family protein [Phycisphaerales bacterium]
MFKRFTALLATVVLTFTTSLMAQDAKHLPGLPGGRVLIVSIDGMRPDAMLRADTPVMRRLMREGTFTMWARTTAMSVTLPSHTSMLTGVTPERHGIIWNKDIPPEEMKYPAFPTLFELAKKTGYSTAMIAGKSKFTALNKPGTIDFVHLPDQAKGGDVEVGDAAVRVIAEHQPQVLFVHFSDADTFGHKFGWGSHEQLRVIANADKQLGRVLDTMKQANVLSQTLIIVTADHGGQGKTHGPDDPRSRHIPWIAAGPGVKADYDLTLDGKLIVNTEDTFATACWFMHIPCDPNIDGKPITQIMGDK